mmetsp:Transcript_25099/g.63846  ORF Transcript_25099/g.63846 Transcript_25099/m.63846 type:complete len:364 (-) Transcript_25099:405-1496(-)
MAGVDIVALGLASQLERWAAFRDENEEALRAWVAAGFGCGRLEAVDGAELRSQSPESLRRLEREGLVDLAEPAVSAMTWGALGTASSHQRLWQRAAASSRPLLILEDEVRLAPGAAAELENALRSLPADGWDILYLGWDLDSEVTLAHPRMPHGSLTFSVRCSRDGKDLAWPPSDGACGGRALLQASHVRGLCAYAVSPRGARALLMRCFPLQGDLDEAVCQGLDQFRGFACFPPLASLPHRGAPASSVAAAADAGGTTVMTFGAGGLSVWTSGIFLLALASCAGPSCKSSRLPPSSNAPPLANNPKCAAYTLSRGPSIDSTLSFGSTMKVVPVSASSSPCSSRSRPERSACMSSARNTKVPS